MIVSVSTGHDTRYLTSQVAAGRESYYLDATTAGEPPGVWWGDGAATFGLSGEVTEKDMTDLFGRFLDPRTWVADHEGGERQGATLGSAPGNYTSPEETVAAKLALKPDALPEEIKSWRVAAEKSARSPVKYIDVTLGVPKSVTVLHTAFHRAELDALRSGNEHDAARWARKREGIESAIWSANNAMLSAMQSAAGHVRASGGDRSGRATRYLESLGWTVASFFQHDSRNHDPHLHIHNAIVNRVISADGKVRSLDSKAIHHYKQYAGAIASRVLVEELAKQGIASEMRPDGKAYEVVGVSREAISLFSGQTRKLTAKAEKLRERLEAATGRAVNSLQMDRLRRQAEFATRNKKSHKGELRADQVERWDRQLRSEVGVSLTRIAHRFEKSTPVEPAASRTKGEFSERGVLQEAVAACQAKRSGWTRPELVRAINDALGPQVGVPADKAARFLEGLAEKAVNDPTLVVRAAGQPMTARVPDELRRSDGASVYDSSIRDVFVSVDHARSEEMIRQAALRQGYAAPSPATVTQWLVRNEHGLRPDQTEAMKGMATSTSGISLLEAAAGTGKTYTAGVLSDFLDSAVEVRRVLVDARYGHELPGHGFTSGGRLYGLTISETAATVLQGAGVDRAMNTERWLGMMERIDNFVPRFNVGGSCVNKGDLEDWLLTDQDMILIDEASMLDTETFTKIREYAEKSGTRICVTGDPAQIGAVGAGGMYHLLANETNTFTLMDVRRFDESWEREGSLGLRAGDPDAISEYERRGRVFDSGTIETAMRELARSSVADRILGKNSVVVTGTNEEAAQISAEVRRLLVDLGHVASTGLQMDLDGNTVGVGDIVACRENDYKLGVLNRRQYEVTGQTSHGGLTLRATDGSGDREVDGAYVRTSMSLGYAGTVHSTQGMTVERCRVLVASMTDRMMLYVGMSRGSELNTAHCVTREVKELSGKEDNPRTAGAIMRDAVQRDTTELSGIEIDENYREHMKNMATVMAYTEDATRVGCRMRLDDLLDRMTERDLITEEDRARLGSDKGTEGLSRLLHTLDQAGMNAEEALTAAIGVRDLSDADSVAQVLYHRIVKELPGERVPDPVGAGRTPTGLAPEMENYLDNLHEIAADRRRELGTAAGENPPAWAVTAWGPPPEDVLERAEWEQKAGSVAAQRESKGWDDPEVAMAPRAGVSSTEQRALDHAAWVALDRPEAFAEEDRLSVGALRTRVKAEQSMRAWAPPYVDDDLEAAHKQAAAAERELVLTGDLDRQDELEAAQYRIAGLEEAMAERDKWFEYQAMTQAVAARAEAELEERGEPRVGSEPDRVTAEELLEAERARVEQDDERRYLDEHDMVEEVEHHQPAEEREEAPATGDGGGRDEATDRIVQAAREAYNREADYRSQDATEPVAEQAPATLPVPRREKEKGQVDGPVLERQG